MPAMTENHSKIEENFSHQKLKPVFISFFVFQLLFAEKVSFPPSYFEFVSDYS